MKYLSLFSGIGGFEKAIEQAYESNNEYAPISEESEPQERQEGGVRTINLNETQLHDRDRTAPLCIGYSEIDRYATKIYQAHYPDHKPYGDITTIVTTELPDFDLLVGGFPCQSFSIAGKRGGFNDTRGTLFFEIARILRDKRPRYFLLENVKGLLSHDSGKTFSTILGVLSDIGYDCQWQVLNSKNFGVPQNRERVFIVGHIRGEPRPKVFPLRDNNGKDNESNKLRIRRKLLQRDEPKSVQEEKASTASEPSGQDSQNRGDKPNDSDERGGSSHTTYNVRRLTPTECARLQGFPDDWHKIEGISDTQAYKCYGNAVTVNVVEEVVKRLF